MNRNHRASTSPSTTFRRRARRLLAAVALCAPLATIGLVPASASALTAPAQDPFYTPPAHLARFAPGTILRARQVTLSGSAQPVTADAYQLMFRSTSATWQPIAAVTTVLVPTSPAPGPRVLATYEPAYDSETLNCAPSYTLQGGNNGGGGTATLEESLIADELAQGWEVNVPDYEGLQSEWTVAPLLGRVSLDSVKAAEHFWPDGLTRGARTEVTFNGYSGGSEAADWAAALAPRYAPGAQHRRHRRRWELPRLRLHPQPTRRDGLVRDRARRVRVLQPRLPRLQPPEAPQPGWPDDRRRRTARTRSAAAARRSTCRAAMRRSTRTSPPRRRSPPTRWSSGRWTA